MSLRWLQPMTGGSTQPDSDGRASSAKGRHWLAAGSRTMEEYTYGTAEGITTYGPSLTQVPPEAPDMPGFGRSATSVAEGYGGTRQGSVNKENSTGAKIAHVSSP